MDPKPQQNRYVFWAVDPFYQSGSPVHRFDSPPIDTNCTICDERRLINVEFIPAAATELQPYMLGIIPDAIVLSDVDALYNRNFKSVAERKTMWEGMDSLRDQDLNRFLSEQYILPNRDLAKKLASVSNSPLIILLMNGLSGSEDLDCFDTSQSLVIEGWNEHFPRVDVFNQLSGTHYEYGGGKNLSISSTNVYASSETIETLVRLSKIIESIGVLVG